MLPSLESYDGRTMSDDPTFVPHLSPAQIQRIRTSPAHRRLKHLVYSQLALAVTGATVNLVCIILGAVWARGVLKEEKWCVLSFLFAKGFSRRLTA